MADAVRIGNCSGFYGDRIAAMREMLTGGELDYLTGDYLAELTMLILGRDRMKNPDGGYAKTFLRQLEDCLGEAQDRGVRIVANAGGIAAAIAAGTATGIAAAIPAVIAYNYFLGQVRKMGVDMDCFAQDFMNIVQRSVVGGRKEN